MNGLNVCFDFFPKNDWHQTEWDITNKDFVVSFPRLNKTFY